MERIAVFLHLYEPSMFGVFESVLDLILGLNPDNDIYISHQHPSDTHQIISTKYPNVIFVHCDRGCDIGGQFVMTMKAQELNKTYDYMLKLHTKTMDNWRKGMMDQLCNSPSQLNHCLQAFRDDPMVGMIAPRDFQIGFYSSDMNCDYIKNWYAEKNLVRSELSTLFCGGTMYWVRWSAYSRSLEEINIAQEYENLPRGGTSTIVAIGNLMHSWERLFCFRITDVDYTIKFIRDHDDTRPVYLPSQVFSPSYFRHLHQEYKNYDDVQLEALWNEKLKAEGWPPNIMALFHSANLLQM